MEDDGAAATADAEIAADWAGGNAASALALIQDEEVQCAASELARPPAFKSAASPPVSLPPISWLLTQREQSAARSAATLAMHCSPVVTSDVQTRYVPYGRGREGIS